MEVASVCGALYLVRRTALLFVRNALFRLILLFIVTAARGCRRCLFVIEI